MILLRVYELIHDAQYFVDSYTCKKYLSARCIAIIGSSKMNDLLYDWKLLADKLIFYDHFVERKSDVTCINQLDFQYVSFTDQIAKMSVNIARWHPSISAVDSAENETHFNDAVNKYRDLDYGSYFG